MILLAKAHSGAQMRQIDEMLREQFEELDVDFKVLGNQQSRWVQVSVEGEDEVVAAAYIRKEIGVCPVNLDTVEEGVELRGYISKVEDQRLLVDVGIFEPKPTQATVLLASVQMQLAEGRQAPLKQIAQVFCLGEGLPVTVKITSKADGLQAELSEGQVERLQSWKQSLLDRLIVLRSSKELITTTLERTRLTRDVIDVESLGLFEYALTCKLGTDAAGVIPRVGRYMRYAVFLVFNAKKCLLFVGE